MSERRVSGTLEPITRGASSTVRRELHLIDVHRVGPFDNMVGVGRFEIEGLGVIGFEVNKTHDHLISIVPTSVHSRLNGPHKLTVRFEPEFAAELLDVVVARLRADEPGEAE
jgi:hypothetical protein